MIIPIKALLSTFNLGTGLDQGLFIARSLNSSGLALFFQCKIKKDPTKESLPSVTEESLPIFFSRGQFDSNLTQASYQSCDSSPPL